MNNNMKKKTNKNKIKIQTVEYVVACAAATSYK